MGSVQARPRRDGSVAYTAQVRIKRDGRVLLTKAATFASEDEARRWMVKAERALAKPGAIDAAVSRRQAMTVGDAIKRYIKEKRGSIGRTKEQVLRSLHAYDIATKACPELTSADIVALAQDLAAGGRVPSTVGNYLSHLSAVLALVKPAWNVDLDRGAVPDAMVACSRLGLSGKSRSRSRRPTLEELDVLMTHFVDRTKRRNALPMHRLTAFAIFSTRRQEEIVRIEWVDLEPSRVLVRDMKHPGEKIGNDVWCELTPEAERIILAAPKTAARIFPYNERTISTAFTRACKLLGIIDLHFHDLRHEGVSRLFELGRTLPLAASVSGHRSWQSLQRYTHIKAAGDKFSGWKWLDIVAPPAGPDEADAG